MTSDQLLNSCDNSTKERRKDLSKEVSALKAHIRICVISLVVAMLGIIIALHFTLSAISVKCSRNEQRYQQIKEEITSIKQSIEWSQ